MQLSGRGLMGKKLLHPDAPCYTYSSPLVEERGAIGAGIPEKSFTNASLPERSSRGYYAYRSAKKLSQIVVGNSTSFAGSIGATAFAGRYGTYSYGGYAVDLYPIRGKHEASSIIRQLIADEWITDATSAVVVSFTVYNRNENIFLYTRVLMEITPGGNVHPSITYRPFRFPGADFKKGDGLNFDAIIRLVFGAQVLLWTIHLLTRCTTSTNAFDAWDAMDLANLLLLALQMLMRLSWQLGVTTPMATRFREYADTDTSYLDFEDMSFWFEFERYLAALNCVTVYFKFFKLTRIFLRLSVIVHVLVAAATSLVSWFFIASLIFVAFVVQAHIFFGPSLFHFSTIGDTIVTLFNYLLTHYDNLSDAMDDRNSKSRGTGLESLQSASSQYSNFLANPVFFFASFTIIFYLFLVRILIAMLITAYTRVKKEIKIHEIMHKEREELKVTLESKSLRNTRCGRACLAYVKYGMIPCASRRASHKLILERLEGDDDLLRKGYLSYAELRPVVFEALGALCSDADIDEACTELLDMQGIAMHRVPHLYCSFHDMHDKFCQDHGEDLAVSQSAQSGSTDKGSSHQLSLSQIDWDRDVLNGNALHASLFVYCEYLKERFHSFSGILAEQDLALRQLLSKILRVEQRLDAVLLQVTGKSMKPLAFETAVGEKIYLEMQSLRKQKIIDIDGAEDSIFSSSEDDEEVGNGEEYKGFESSDESGQDHAEEEEEEEEEDDDDDDGGGGDDVDVGD
eukprot:g4036.t1